MRLEREQEHLRNRAIGAPSRAQVVAHVSHAVRFSILCNSEEPNANGSDWHFSPTLHNMYNVFPLIFTCVFEFISYDSHPMRSHRELACPSCIEVNYSMPVYLFSGLIILQYVLLDVQYCFIRSFNMKQIDSKFVILAFRCFIPRIAGVNNFEILPTKIAIYYFYVVHFSLITKHYLRRENYICKFAVFNANTKPIESIEYRKMAVNHPISNSRFFLYFQKFHRANQGFCSNPYNCQDKSNSNG